MTGSDKPLPPSTETQTRSSAESASWPPHTVASAADVTIAGISLARLVEWAGTPCVHNPEVESESQNRADSAHWSAGSVVVTRVIDVRISATGSPEVVIDADLAGCRPIVSAARMIGRASTSTCFTMLVRRPGDDGARFVVDGLPADLRAGDLLAIPCVGTTTLHDVRLPVGIAHTA